MSTDIGGRPVLRPAGNVARANLKKATKPPPSPVKPHAKNSPPNSQPPTPKTRSLLSKPSPSPPPSPPPSKHSTCLSLPTKPPSPAELVSSEASPHPANEDANPAGSQISSDVLNSSLDGLNDLFNGPNQTVNGLFKGPNQAVDGSMAAFNLDKSSFNGSSPALTGSRQAPSGWKASTNGSKKVANATRAPKPLQETPKSPSSSCQAPARRAQKAVNPQISLTKSTSDVFQRGTTSTVKAKPADDKKSLNKLGSLSFDESSLATMVAARKAAAHEAIAQRKLKVAEYGRKQGKTGRVAPEASSPVPAAVELKRCKFITAQSDPLYVAYHDQEWGMPVHDDRMLFELLVLSGFQVELSWTTILHKRDTYRMAFLEFSSSAVAQLTEKQILSLEADKMLGLPGGKVRGVVENAQRIMEVLHEFGSLDAYLWAFLNNQPMINSYRYPKQVPVKTSKAESISKDLVRRGFRFVGPTIIYSFMQAAGMTNDHLVECFRHQECMKLPCPPLPVVATKQEEESCRGSCHQQCEVPLSPTHSANDGESGEEMLYAGSQELLIADEEWPHQSEILMDIIEPRAFDFSVKEVLCVEEVHCADSQDVSTANDHVPEVPKDWMEPEEQKCYEAEGV